jgi:hypothetical protein
VTRWQIAPCVLVSMLLWSLAAAEDYPDSPPPGFPETAPVDPGDSPYDDPSDPVPRPDEYEDALAPYGSWQADPQYGRFWRPGVAAGWQPYLDGRWVWTAYGWTWVSNEPWSWTFHYGRWGYLPAWGWGWFPGSTWAPAWVRWNTYGGYVGWAPLSPFGYPPFNRYVFVRDYDLCAPWLRRHVIPPGRVPWDVRMRWRDHSGWPDRRAIERVSRHPVRVLPDRPGDSLAPWLRGGGRQPPGNRQWPGGRQRPGDWSAREGPGRQGRPDRPFVPGEGPEVPAPRLPGLVDRPGRRDRDDRPTRGGLRPERPPRPQRAERPSFPRPRGQRPPINEGPGTRPRIEAPRLPRGGGTGDAGGRGLHGGGGGPGRAGQGGGHGAGTHGGWSSFGR